MEFEKVNKEHILLGIKDYEEKGLPEGFGPSTMYDLINEGKKYPPKAVMAYANYHAINKPPTNYFYAGPDKDCFKAFVRNGFEVLRKHDDPIAALIVRYKKRIKKSKLKDEIYKWKLVEEFKGRPDTSAVDFAKEVKEVKFQNLIYAMAIAVINHLSKDASNELKILFNKLFDETKSLKDRVENYKTDSLILYRKIGGQLGHHQDERTIATYLTFHNPEHYTFYKNSFYSKYCELIGVPKSKTGEKYVHYLSLINDFINDYIKDDKELIEMVKSFVPQYDGVNHLLLAQDILFQTLEKQASEMEIFDLLNNFIDQANAGDLKTKDYPNKYKGYDLKISFGQGVLERIPWVAILKEPNTVSKGIYPVYLYYIEKNQLVLSYGISETEKSDQTWSNTDGLKTIKEWHNENYNENPDRYGDSFVKSIYNLDNELNEEQVKKDLEELLLEYNKTEVNTNDFEKIISEFNPNDLEVYFSFLKEIVQKFNIQKGDERIVFSCQNSRLNFTVGQRYCWNLYSSDKRGRFGAISKNKLNDKSENYDGKPPQPYYTYLNDVNFSDIEKETIFEAISDELNRTRKSGYLKYNNIDFENIIFNNEKKAMSQSLNQILFGPPGTGKTYNSINYAISIIENVDVNIIANEERERVIERYNKYVENGQVVFITFHQSVSYEDFIEGIKPVVKDNDSGLSENISYEIQNGVFKDIVERINDNESFVNSSNSGIFIPQEKFDIPINKISLGDSNIVEDQDIYEYCMKNNCIAIGFGEDIDFSGVTSRVDIRKKYAENGIEISNSMDFNISAIDRFVLWMKKGQLVFVSNGQKKLKAIGEITGDYYFDNNSPIRYNQFRKVKWLYKDIDIPIKEIYGKYFMHQTIYQLAHDKINKSFFIDNSKSKNNKKLNYVLIIDEINRGNVSAIFGELITLLETDKRIGNKEGLTTLLPYSKENFGVPNNLFLLGTMNTADRSVEALDTALRRRFSFVEMMPNSSLLMKKTDNGIDLGVLLNTINERLEVLLDRDHTIGHSYFMDVKNEMDLRDAFKDKIIPLLQEYFYGDYGKIGLVLGKGFVEKKKKNGNLFPDFDYDGKGELNREYYILKTIDANFPIIEALGFLLSENKEA
jgi:5-methylcytosine-specific restriction endonuclease McrBC GTP-binding regulatory subunit McrB